MITVHAPITIYQFDEQRFARMEQALQAMRDQLQEVLTSRQGEIDALTKELKTDVDAQKAATAADSQPPTT